MQKRVAAGIAKLGENMAVPRFVRYAGQGYVGQYIHLGGKIGVQVEFGGVDAGDRPAATEFATLVKEIAMQIAAASPAYVSRDGGARPTCSRRRRRSTGRRWRTPASRPTCIDKIVEGKLGSFYAQVVLPDQPSIRDPKMTVDGRASPPRPRRSARRSRSRASRGSRSAKRASTAAG